MDLTRSRPCQALLRLTRAQNTPQIGNTTPAQNAPAIEGDLISFDKNPPTYQPREVNVPAVDPEIGPSIERNKTILIYKNIPNGLEFHDANNEETTIEAYKRINKESEAIAEKTNGQVDMPTTGALVFAERYEGEAIRYDVNSMYVYEMLKRHHGQGTLCEQRNGQNYGTHPRIKPFLLASARKEYQKL
ncbi:66_t:CDS:2 [Ambispora leptoticha]|uniref:66_t:CDS:1 n=1 Tax=Ambispora leptoticha TaxID=144679 RepID=A0A9N9C3A0_9GLOM|nr:66_t:CDS:2 [Ambispora leptoticha]